MTFESILGVLLFKTGMFQRIKNQINFTKFKTWCSEACSLKKCTLPYIYFVFKCLVFYFGIKKEWLENSLNTFSLAANILKSLQLKEGKTKILEILCVS